MIDCHEIKLSAYADDVNFLTANVQSLNLIFKTCETFKHFSYLKMNREKSESCTQIDLSTHRTGILGVFNIYDTDLANNCNFSFIVGKIENCVRCGVMEISHLHEEHKFSKLSLSLKQLTFSQ